MFVSGSLLLLQPPAPTPAPPSFRRLHLNTDGFVIPCLGIGNSDESRPSVPVIESSNSPAQPKKEENIHLGPHGAPPSHSKQQELSLLSQAEIGRS